MEVIRQDGGVLQIRGDLHISEGEELRKLLLEELTSTATTLVLDLSAVESCDTASIQLLCALRKSAGKIGKEFSISAPSAAMRESSATLGLSLEDLAYIPTS